MPARHLARWELDGVDGAVVVIDVLRAFTTAAYAFAAGATAIHLVGTIDEALDYKAAHPEALGGEHVHPDDVVYATRIDAFSFAMEVVRTPEGILLTASIA